MEDTKETGISLFKMSKYSEQEGFKRFLWLRVRVQWCSEAQEKGEENILDFDPRKSKILMSDWV